MFPTAVTFDVMMMSYTTPVSLSMGPVLRAYQQSFPVVEWFVVSSDWLDVLTVQSCKGVSLEHYWGSSLTLAVFVVGFSASSPCTSWS